MDNARIHHYKEFKKLLANNDLTDHIIYNVPYHPQYNPIECVFNVIKQHINKQHITNYDTLNRHIKNIIRKLNKSGLENYYNHSFEKLMQDIT